MSTSENPRNGSVVTMRDVAKAAGVSVATVSHVINDKAGARIGENARQRVQEAVARLGYRPNALAKTLSQGTSRFIGLVADAIATTPFAGQIIHGAQDEAWRHGYVLLVANTDGNAAVEQEAIAMMLEHQVHGILYSSWYHREIVVPDALHQTDTVLVDCFAVGSGLLAVVPDEEQGGRTATEELLAAGHRRIAFLNTTSDSPAQTGRLAGYRAALASANIPFDESLVFPAAPEQEGGYSATAAVLASEATAVFCHNDRVAMGLYDGLRERGLRIPEDMAVIGFDNQDVIAAHLRPPLTTVALPHYELGAAGVRLLLGLESASPTTPTLIACPPIRRDSI
ncbi:LacI family DNA-binding transcriptional regulator [Rathayibacter sp. VKM Ac-2803]|uniref:LacI family DNA-binding transcriptional regulator n=1 Tax=unclassified Rathayibacter TaxID=2609250 RepID=UPI001356B66E|nr:MULTISPECIES: LacI family DNA-binding transcriptional regulator [unclassified Rathayibacter]MWV48124.1 LacI family DNA-binding transcriptional regulator [Rathayibacter sp. VKM Ac-2803]MWV59383.1 LacI family DNA-binding transcriptional regulator [Rathayibacter sp. VKM Ac-2754]